MGRITTLFGAVAALTLISTVAKSQDGCAPGWYYDGRQCVAETGPGYYDPPPPAYYPPPPPAYYPPPPPPAYYPPPPLPDSDYVPLTDRGMQLRFDSEEARYSPPNPAFKTWNNCPPNFTVQDGLCKPYTGR
jgi:hypothetical protein